MNIVSVLLFTVEKFLKCFYLGYYYTEESGRIFFHLPKFFYEDQK